MILGRGNRLGIALICVSTVLSTLATLAVILRLWSRRIQSVAFMLNDYAAVVALV